VICRPTGVYRKSAAPKPTKPSLWWRVRKMARWSSMPGAVLIAASVCCWIVYSIYHSRDPEHFAVTAPDGKLTYVVHAHSQIDYLRESASVCPHGWHEVKLDVGPPRWMGEVDQAIRCGAAKPEVKP
jgi:hypothetical protein